MLSTQRPPCRFLYAGRDSFAGELTSLLRRESIHTFLATNFATSRSLLHEEISNILW
jgi:hypothetical protein